MEFVSSCQFTILLSFALTVFALTVLTNVGEILSWFNCYFPNGSDVTLLMCSLAICASYSVKCLHVFCPFSIGFLSRGDSTLFI